MKNGVELNETSRITIQSEQAADDVFGETNSTVTVVDLQLSDAGIYNCMANNTGALTTTFTAVSRKVTITVLCKFTY